ncbi:hypothetical protein GJ744_009670 [Endocarpon pusillum]|uniref:Uncharacterized protein n=1 Tax=Endocarpon pusillum TaxID=364733 RepID=A0A8H7AFN6_9EURO|nr:hypothetical protein GJ744_009670 [Endocarpon pusillum]
MPASQRSQFTQFPQFPQIPRFTQATRSQAHRVKRLVCSKVALVLEQKSCQPTVSPDHRLYFPSYISQLTFAPPPTLLSQHALIRNYNTVPFFTPPPSSVLPAASSLCPTPTQRLTG